MDIDTLKTKTITVKYIVPDTLPERGLKRLQYYVCFPEEPNRFYFGLSFRNHFEKASLRNMVKSGALFELIEPITVPYEKDLWVDYRGRIILANGYSPLEDSGSRIVATPRQLKKSHMLLDRQLKEVPLPQISLVYAIN